MRFSTCRLLLLAFGFAVVAAGQQASHSAPAHKPATWKRYCQSEGGFCFKYPSSWSMLGDIFEGNGVVVAPPQKGERALWDAVTVALVVPRPDGDEEPLGLNGVIDQATSGLREAGQDFVTVQRQQRTVDHKPAQLLKVRYHQNSNARDWIEEMIFIEGPNNEIYSVALKCSPLSLARLEPIFSQVLASWTLPEPQPPAGATEEAPKQPKTTPPAKPH